MTKKKDEPASPDSEAEVRAPQADEMRPVEVWAELKGYVNEPPPKGHALNLERQREWIHKCALVKAKWALGKLVTEAEYDAAVEAAMGVSMR